MTYRWEPTTPLDRILATGFKRMDEAVEGVIDRIDVEIAVSGACITVYIDQPDLEDFWHNAQRRYNYQMSKMIEEMPVATPVLWPVPDHCKAGAESQMENK